MTYPVPTVLTQSPYLNLLITSAAAPSGYPIAISQWTTDAYVGVGVGTVIGYSGPKFSIYIPIGTTKVSVLLSTRDLSSKSRKAVVATDLSAITIQQSRSFVIGEELGVITPKLGTNFKVISTVEFINYPVVIYADSPTTSDQYVTFEMDTSFYAETQLSTGDTPKVSIFLHGDVANHPFIKNSTLYAASVTSAPVAPSPSPSPAPAPSTCSTGNCVVNVDECGTGNIYTPTEPTDLGGNGGGVIVPIDAFDPNNPSDIGELLTKLSGLIDSSHLANDLRQRIPILDNLNVGYNAFKTSIINDNKVLANELVGLRNAVTGFSAYIQDIQDIEVNERYALTQTINRLVATIGTRTAALEEKSLVMARINGSLLAEKTIKIDLSGHVAGYGLSAEMDPNGDQISEFRVAADRFSIAPDAYNSYTTPPANMLFEGFVWQDMSTIKIDPNTGKNIGTTKWWVETTQTWSLTTVKAAQPLVYLTSPTTLPDGTVVKPGLYVNQATIYKLTADKIDTRGLVIKDSTGKILFGGGNNLDWSLVSGIGRPADGATVGAPIGTLVAGVRSEDMATVATNFNKANDRNAAAITAPSIPNSSVEHALQTDGSADISFDWIWGGNESAIDGFFVFVHQSSSNVTHTFGTNPSNETIYTVPAGKRSFIVYGTAADKFYTFGVQAYRSVDPDISATGVIRTTIATAAVYRPASLIAFNGNVVGTINGIQANTLVQDASNALSIANKAKDDLITINGIAADIASDNKLTPVEKQTTRGAWDTIIREFTGIYNQATDLGAVSERDLYLNAVGGLGYYLNAGNSSINLGTTIPLWINDQNLSVTTDIHGPTFRSMWSAYGESKQGVLNAIAREASKRADWSTVSGTGKPQDNADVTANNTAAGIKNQGALATQNWVNVGSTVRFPDGSVMNTGDFINRLSKIGTNNISTFMESAAIGNAYIGNAAVKTLNIDGNAVIVPSGSTGVYSASVTLSMDFPGVVAIIGTFTQGGGKNRHAWRVTMNGSTLQAENPIEGTLGSITTGSYVGAGVHTFAISCDVTTGDGRCGIVVLGIKR